jgi:hypothetical protein
MDLKGFIYKKICENNKESFMLIPEVVAIINK